ncbi:MAG: transcriptional regulator, partial [Acidimicrobiia bacterium]|nr:transcriptional regulator [Acidimicrobiia bacterium]
MAISSKVAIAQLSSAASCSTSCPGFGVKRYCCRPSTWRTWDVTSTGKRQAPSGEICACDLPDAVGRAQPTVSHHLAVLVRAGLVLREQRGKWAWFSIAENELA